MLNAAVAALACLCLARTSPAEPYSLRAYSQNLYSTKDISSILANIEERLRVIDTVSVAQAKQSRKLEVIQDKLDRVETTLTLKLERAQLAAERLEHRLHMLQTSVQTSIKESSEKIERSQSKIAELAQNLTNHINTHKTLLEKVNGAYADTWRRGLVLESLMRDGLSLVNVTRRELADGLRALARRQRDSRLSNAELEASFARRLHDDTHKLDVKMQEVLDIQKQYMDSCQPVQQDDPDYVAMKLDKVFEALLDKIETIFNETHAIKKAVDEVRDHDNKVMKILNKQQQADAKTPCRRLENVFRNTSYTLFKETELKQLTEKFVALTDRADAALQKLEKHFAVEDDGPEPASEITAEADMLMRKLKGIKNEEETDDDLEWDDETGYFEDGGGGDIMDEDRQLLSQAADVETTTARPAHRRHLHKHPYDRGPHYQRHP